MDICVVVFEDNLLLRESLYQLINGTTGLNCVGTFDNCDNIIFNIKKTAPHVALVDIQMPGTNGIEGAKLIKENFPQLL